MKHEIHTIQALDQMKRIQTKNMKIIHNNKKNALILIKKFHQDYFSWSASAEWVKKENQQLLSDTQNVNHEKKKSEKEFSFNHNQKSHHETWYKYEDFEIFNVVRKYCNRTTLINSLKILMKFLTCT